MSINQHGISADMIEIARKIMRGEKIEEKKKLDPVGQADADIDNDGDTDASDKYLHKRRKAITKAVDEESIAELDEKLETDGPNKPSLDKMFKRVPTTPASRAYSNKKASQRADMNKKNDPGADKKGLALSVVDREKAKKKAKEQGVGEAVDVDTDNAQKAVKHDCATHIVHKEHGEGRCIPGMHTLEENEDGTGYVTHYDVMFQGEDGPFIVEDCPVEDLEIVQEMSHGHKKKK
jgi:hypothetical protein